MLKIFYGWGPSFDEFLDKPFNKLLKKLLKKSSIYSKTKLLELYHKIDSKRDINSSVSCLYYVFPNTLYYSQCFISI